MSRTILSVISFLILSTFLNAQDTSAIVKKAPVLAATDEDQQFAISKTEQLIKDINTVPPLFDKFLLIGPRLWSRIKEEPNFKDIEHGNLTIKVPKFEQDGSWTTTENVQGKLLQEIVPYLKLWTYIKQNYDLDKAKIVEKNDTDKFISWQYFAKVEEPLIAIESEKARLILKYTKGRLFFIEITSR